MEGGRKGGLSWGKSGRSLSALLSGGPFCHGAPSPQRALQGRARDSTVALVHLLLIEKYLVHATNALKERDFFSFFGLEILGGGGLLRAKMDERRRERGEEGGRRLIKVMDVDGKKEERRRSTISSHGTVFAGYF